MATWPQGNNLSNDKIYTESLGRVPSSMTAEIAKCMQDNASTAEAQNVNLENKIPEGD